MQKMKQLRNVICSVGLLGLICLTGCKSGDSSQNKSESTSLQDITESTEVSSYEENTEVSVSKKEDTVTTIPIKTIETSMKENQSAATTTKTGTSSPSDKKEPDSITTTITSNTTIHKTETTTVTLPDNEEQVTHKRDENELPGVDPFA